MPTSDLLNDRGMMGDGVVDLRRIRRAVEDAGYTGFIEVEIFSDDWWAQPMDHVLATCVERPDGRLTPSSRAKPPKGRRSRGTSLVDAASK